MPRRSSILGTTLDGRYRVIDVIARGAMGAVWRAIDEQTGREVALKQLLDVEHARRFEAEARLLARLSHPRVVRILAHFSEASGQYLVMALVPGADLAERLIRVGRPGLPVEEAIGYITQTCEALQYVHDQQIVHRDIKPQNLIVSERGIVLVDFGIARTIDERELSGTVGIGTPRFMAPEVLHHGTVSARTDVFGVAATLWTLLTGRPPVFGDLTPLRELVPALDPELERVIRAGLDPAPGRRFASVRAFAEALGAQVSLGDGQSLALSIGDGASFMEQLVRVAAGVFDAAASSVCLVDDATGELVYHSAWGAGADDIVGVRLPGGTGITGGVVARGTGEVIADCRSDTRFAAAVARGTGYVPYTMLVVPLLRGPRAIGALSLLDRRDGEPYQVEQIGRAALFAELAVSALRAVPGLHARTDMEPTLDLTQG